MLQQDQEVEADVRQEDQQRINTFGKNNARLVEILNQLEEMKLETYDDAATELMMGDGETVEIMISQSFVEVEEEFATSYLEQLVEKTKLRMEQLQKEDAALQVEQAALKKQLYGRFGSSINLEA